MLTPLPATCLHPPAVPGAEPQHYQQNLGYLSALLWGGFPLLSLFHGCSGLQGFFFCSFFYFRNKYPGTSSFHLLTSSLKENHKYCSYLTAWFGQLCFIESWGTSITNTLGGTYIRVTNSFSHISWHLHQLFSECSSAQEKNTFHFKIASKITLKSEIMHSSTL